MRKVVLHKNQLLQIYTYNLLQNNELIQNLFVIYYFYTTVSSKLLFIFKLHKVLHFVKKKLMNYIFVFNLYFSILLYTILFNPR